MKLQPVKAYVMDIPVVGIYGPKGPAIYGPYDGKAIVIKKDVHAARAKKEHMVTQYA